MTQKEYTKIQNAQDSLERIKQQRYYIKSGHHKGKYGYIDHVNFGILILRTLNNDYFSCGPENLELD